MKAAIFREIGAPLTIENISISKPGPREVLIRTAAAGVCHSDLHFIDGLYPAVTPMVLGHESSGVVEQVGSDVTYVKKAITSSLAYRLFAAIVINALRATCLSAKVQRSLEPQKKILD